MEKMPNLSQEEAVPLEENRIEKIITHEGVFHTDEVFATAILKDLFPESMELKEGGKIDYVKYLRTRDKNTLEAHKKSKTSMVLDVGGEYDPEKFNLDHHQTGGAGERENTVQYATAGLVWNLYGREWLKYVDVYSRHMNLSGEEIDLVWEMIDKKYIQSIDANDTGQMKEMAVVLEDGAKLSGKEFNLAEITRLYNVDVNDGRNQEERFRSIVEIFRNLILAIAYKYMDLIKGIRKFDVESCEFSEDRKTVVINQKLSPETIAYLLDNNQMFKNVEFYAVLGQKDAYNIMVAPTAEGLREYRNPDMIPEELRLGNDQEKINKMIGVETGVKLVHTAGYFASCSNLETAKKFLEYCINNKKRNNP